MEALSCIPTRELSSTRLIPDNFIQLLTLLASASSTSNHTQVGFYRLKKLRLSREPASPRAWEGHPDECEAAYEESRAQIFSVAGYPSKPGRERAD